MSAHKLGYITASIVSNFLTGKDPAKLLVGQRTACGEIASERAELEGLCHSDPDFDGFSGNKFTEYGLTYESDAIQRYEEQTFTTVTDSQTPAVDEALKLSCTPDGYVGEDGLIEVKTITQLKAWVGLDADEYVKKHYDQMQFQMMLTGRKWCDLVLYMPRFIQPYDIRIIRIEADPEWLGFAQVRLPLCEQLINEIYTNFKQEFYNVQ